MQYTSTGAVVTRVTYSLLSERDRVKLKNMLLNGATKKAILQDIAIEENEIGTLRKHFTYERVRDVLGEYQAPRARRFSKEKKCFI
jgi:hypothetical protein